MVELVFEFDVAEDLRRLRAGSAPSSSSFSWLISAQDCKMLMSPSVSVEELAVLSVVSSSSAAPRPRLSVAPRFGCSGAVEGEGEVGDAGAAVFVRVTRCLPMGCFFLALDLVVVVVAVRDEKSGSEPIVAVVETLLSVEREEASLVVDPMVAMVELLRSDEVLEALLDVDSMSAMA